MTFLGDDQALNYAVAKVVGSRLGWFAVDMAKVICGMRKVASLDELSKEDKGQYPPTHKRLAQGKGWRLVHQGG